MARVLTCLEEVGAEYELVPMSRSGGDHRQPEHLARNVCIVRFFRILSHFDHCVLPPPGSG
jgi:hypothetical protein